MTTHTDDSLGSIPAGEAGEPVAWLVHGGRHYVDRAFISRNFAEQSVDERRDGAVISPLYLAPSLAPAAAVRLTEPMVEASYQVFVADGWKVGLHELRGTLRKAIPAAITLGAAAPAGGETTLAERIDELVKQHGSLRAVSRVLEVDVAYLHRLKVGDKTEPGDTLLRRMKLRRVVSYERVDAGGSSHA